jgi:NAD(P)-dependent dehydrogenase (short-subunit alcohol dehydrogenase family)
MRMNEMVRMEGDENVELPRKQRDTATPEVVVVTGASAGVGRAVARRFAQEGAHVGLIARGADGLNGALRDVESLGGRGLMLPLDVADAEAVERAAAQVEDQFGPIDIWVNNATVTVFSRVWDMTPDEFKRVTEVTYLGVVYGTLAALKRMMPRDSGVIVQVGSALAYRAIPLQSAYCAGKHAIEGFTESLRTELMHDGKNVHVTMVQLPALNTPQFDWNKTRLPNQPQPVPPIYQPEVAAEAIYFAAHSRRREISVGYPTIKAIYGNKLAPWYADKVLAETGFESQQADRPVQPDRPNNLWQPLPGDHGAHGRFDDESKDFSAALWANMHRGILAAGGLLLAGAAALTLSQREVRE